MEAENLEENEGLTISTSLSSYSSKNDLTDSLESPRSSQTLTENDGPTNILKEPMIPVRSNREKVCPLRKTNFPRSYYVNSLKEKVLADHFCRVFSRQFSSKYPLRQLPLLFLPNDVGTQKMVCTAVNVSKIPFFKTWQNVATFIWKHMSYVPLEIPTLPPVILRAPNSVLASQRGNCLELSSLLVSLLQGIGVDAYVVLGYASQEVCENNQSLEPCPVTINIPEDKEPGAPEDFEDKETLISSNRFRIDLSRDPKYKFNPGDNRDYESRTDKRNRQKKLQQLDEKQIKLEEKLKKRKKLLENKAINRTDQLHGYRIHSWVLVYENFLLDKKEKTSENASLLFTKMTNLFSSGIYSKIFKSSVNPLDNLMRRMKLSVPYFIEPSTGLRREVDDAKYLGIEAVWNHNNYWVNKKPSQAGYTFNLNDRTVWKPLLKLKWQRMTLDVFEKKVLKRLTMKYAKKRKPGRKSKKKCNVLRIKFRMSDTWTESVRLEVCKYLRDKYDGKQAKKVVYYKTLLKQYEELDHPMGLVTSIENFSDVNYIYVEKVVEQYKNRRDHMIYQRLNYSDRKLQQYFHRGRSDGLKMFERNTFGNEYHLRAEFFGQDRKDEMESLDIDCQHNVVRMTFKKRKDFIIEIYGKLKKNDSSSSSHELFENSSSSLARLSNQVESCSILYGRNPKVPNNQDVEKITFFPILDLIEVDFHTGEYDIGSTRYVITKTAFDLEKDARDHLKIYYYDPYELDRMSVFDCFRIIKRFADVRDDVLMRIQKTGEQMRAILIDRKQVQNLHELQPRATLLETNSTLFTRYQMEEKIRKCRERITVLKCIKD